MEATGETAGLLDKIAPPRLEDAGLENCALPPESIKEAFLKAATAVRSNIFSSDESDDDCVTDPWTDLGDKLVGINPEADTPGPCAAKKGGGIPDGTGSDVVVPGVSDEPEDKVLDPEVLKEGEACIGGLEGLHIADKPNGEEEDKEGDKPILVEAYV